MFNCHLFVSHYVINYTFVAEKVGLIVLPPFALYN
jgi:hypothetical protein